MCLGGGGGVTQARKVASQLIAKMITTGNLSFSVVDSSRFHRVLQFFAHWHMPPACMMLSKSLVPMVFEAAREFLKVQMLHTCGEPVHIWTSQGASNAYLSLIVHW